MRRACAVLIGGLFFGTLFNAEAQTESPVLGAGVGIGVAASVSRMFEPGAAPPLFVLGSIVDDFPAMGVHVYRAQISPAPAAAPILTAPDGTVIISRFSAPP